MAHVELDIWTTNQRFRNYRWVAPGFALRRLALETSEHDKMGGISVVSHSTSNKVQKTDAGQTPIFAEDWLRSTSLALEKLLTVVHPQKGSDVSLY